MSSPVPILLRPDLVDDGGIPLTALERAVVARFDGLRTIEDVASVMVVAVGRVRALIAQLEWYGVVALDELVVVDEVDLLDEEPREAEAVPLARGRARRRPAATFPCTEQDTSLVSMVLAALSQMDAAG